jgi:hypothetical protein
MVTMVTTVVLVAYNTLHDHGSGLSPGPTHAQMHIIAMLNIICGTYITWNMRGCTGWAAFPKALPYPRRSQGRLLLSAKVLTNKQVIRGGLSLGHVSHSHSLPKNIICHLSNKFLPCQRTVCHVIHTVCHIIVRTDCTDWYSQHPFFSCLPF